MVDFEFKRSERGPDLSVTVKIPWELVREVKEASFRYGGSPTGEANPASIRKLVVDAIARELRAQGYSGSGSDVWYGSPMHQLRAKELKG